MPPLVFETFGDKIHFPEDVRRLQAAFLVGLLHGLSKW